MGTGRTSLIRIVGLYSCLAGGSQNGLESLLGMASETRKVGRRIPGTGTGAIRYERAGGTMDANKFSESRERKRESSEAEKFSAWRESGRVDVDHRRCAAVTANAEGSFPHNPARSAAKWQSRATVREPRSVVTLDGSEEISSMCNSGIRLARVLPADWF